MKSQESGVRRKKLISTSVVLFTVGAIAFLPACAKKEEAPKVQKVKKFTPEYKVITEEKLAEWLRATEKVGEFIRRFALEDEEVADKRDFMSVAHSSERTEIALKSLFEDTGLKQGEFWWIMDRFDEARKYTEIKAQEESQNARIDTLLAAGREERATLDKSLEKERSEGKRRELERRLGIVNAKFSELSSLKGHTTPEKAGVEPANIEIWRKNKERIETAIKKMWKVKPGGKSEIPRDKSIPGH